MKRIFILLMLFVIANEAFGQAQTKWWYFGSFAGVEFLPSGPIANNQGALSTTEGCASIADRCGQLQFYTDGSTAWNRNHQIMLNGVGLGGNSSSTQSGIIVPRPNDANDRIYYLISVNTVGNVTYNVVDMTLDGGLGGVVVNPPRRINNVINNGAEKLTAVASPDGNTVWILLFSNSTGTGTPFNTIHAFPITAAGINIAGKVTTTFPSLPNITDRRGYMQLSPDGTKLAVVTHSPSSAFMFDFNPATGIPSNPTTINYSLGQQNLYGAAFSRDNTKFYLDTNSAGGNGTGTRTLLQYDLTLANYQNTPATVPGATNITGEGRGALQLGIDCKIYHARKHPWLAVIDNPNAPAASLTYTNNGVGLTANGNEGLPPFLSSLLAEVDFNLVQGPLDGDVSQFNLNAALCSTTPITWDFGDGSPPVSGVTNPTHTFPSDGIYTVTVTVDNPFATPSCGVNTGAGFPQDFQIFKTPVDPLIEIVECDTDGSGSNDFDLTALANTILGAQPAGEFFEVSFHTTQFNAENDLAPINQANPLNLPLGPNNLFIRITNLDCASTYPGLVCHRVFEINLIVVEDPTAGAVSDFVVCDTDGVNDGLSVFDLSIKDVEVLNGQPAAPFTITYHNSQADADNDVNPLPIPYNNVANNEEVFARIEANATDANGQTVCFDTTSFFLIVNDQPVANTTSNIEACDDAGNDGTESIDLNAAIADIIGTQTSFPFSVTFHDSQADADTGANALPNPLDVTVGTRTVFARIANDNNSECFDTLSFDIILSINPQITSISDERLCDVGADDTESFDLAAKIPEILGAFNAADVNISFHNSQADADNNVSPLTSPYANATNPETIFVRMESQSIAQCFDTASFQIFVDEIPIAGTAANLPLCDIGNDQTEDVDLSAAFDAFILNGQNAAQFEITYHTSQADADTGANPLASPFTVNQSTPTFFARIENVDNPECFDTTSFDIEIFDQPIANAVNDFVICDSPGNEGIGSFVLTNADAEVLGGQNPADFTITYHNTQADADNDVNPLASPYSNTTNPETIFVRIENALNGACFDTTSFQLILDEQPTAGTVADFALCDNGNDGSEAIDLTTFDADVINTQTGPYSVSYFDSQADADNNVNALPSTITVNAGTIRTVFARIFNTNNPDCFDTTSFDIEIFVQPVANAVNNFVVCDDPSNDGLDTFMLTNANAEVLGGQNPADFIITYHNSQADADNGANPLASPYSNTSNPETIFVRIENVLSAACFDTTSFQLIIDEQPTAGQPLDIEVCDDSFDNDGVVPIDLSQQDSDVLNGQSAAVFGITYHASQNNAINGTTPLNPNYQTSSANEVIWVRIFNASNPNCFDITSFTITVHPLPIIPPNDDLLICAGEPTVLDAGAGFASYTWSTGETTQTITVSNGGTFTVEVESFDGCTATSSFTIIESDVANLDQLNVRMFQPRDNSIEVLVSGPGDYEFSLDNLFFQDSNVFRNLAPGRYTVYVNDKNGCGLVSTEVSVVAPPQYFTPNADGFHDTWQVVGIEEFPDAKIYIFDRFGKLLKQLNPLGPGWDGTFNGNRLPSSDYWYRIELADGQHFRGHFALKR